MTHRVFRMLLVLSSLLVGCAATPHDHMLVVLPAAHSPLAPTFGFVVDATAWHCTLPPGAHQDCDRCVNITSSPQELSTGIILRDGTWDVTRRHFPAGAVVRLCRPTFNRLAQSYP